MENTMEMHIEAQHTKHDTPLGLDTALLEETRPGLDRLVSSLFILFHQYQKHHWIVEGPQFRDLHLYLEEAYKEVHEDLDALAERLTVLGGIPTSSPTEQAERAFVRHESEGAPHIRTMLHHDMEMELAIAQFTRDLITKTGNDFGTETMLKHALLRGENRIHHLEHYLERSSLVPFPETESNPSKN